MRDKALGTRMDAALDGGDDDMNFFGAWATWLACDTGARLYCAGASDEVALVTGVDRHLMARLSVHRRISKGVCTACHASFALAACSSSGAHAYSDGDDNMDGGDDDD